MFSTKHVLHYTNSYKELKIIKGVMNIVCPACNNKKYGKDSVFKTKTYLYFYDIHTLEAEKVSFIQCETCGFNFLGENKKGITTDNYHIYKNNFFTFAQANSTGGRFEQPEYLLQTVDEQCEFIDGKTCSITKKQLCDSSILIYRNNVIKNAPIHYIDNSGIKMCEFTGAIEGLDGVVLLPFYNRDNHRKKYVWDIFKHRVRNKYFEGEKNYFKSNTFKNNPFDRMVGIELETIGGDFFSSLDLPEEIRDFVTCHYDGSLYDSNCYGEEDDLESDLYKKDYEQNSEHDLRGSGREFVTNPANGDELFNKLQVLSSFLVKKRCLTNKSCGFHVHYDARNLDETTIKKIYTVLSVFQETFYNMLPPSRKESRYCRPVKDNYRKLFGTKFDYFWYDCEETKLLTNMKVDKYNATRYVGINFHSLAQHNTVENRMHSGTINFVKIRNWILINQILIDYAVNSDWKSIFKLNGSLEQLNRIIRDYEKKYSVLKSYDLVSYVVSRNIIFKNNSKNYSRVKNKLYSTGLDKARALKGFNNLFSPEYKSI